MRTATARSFPHAHGCAHRRHRARRASREARPGLGDVVRFLLVVGAVSVVSKPAALFLALAWGFHLLRRGALAEPEPRTAAPEPRPPDPAAGVVRRAGDDPHVPANLRRAEDALSELDGAERGASAARRAER
jgi:hypothetical protein